MADLVGFGNTDRDIVQASIALKKGAQLLKYGRKGKPKVYPFRLSNLKDMVVRSPPGVCDTESLKLVYLPNGLEPKETNGNSYSKLPNGGSSVRSCGINASKRVDAEESKHNKDAGNDLKSKNNACSQIEAECIEQLYEPGVHMTLVSLQDGTRDLRRVRFSRRRFGEQQAETWWLEYQEKVCKRYNISCGSHKVSVSGPEI